MKRLLTLLLALTLAAAALALPSILSEAQNRLYLDATNRQSLPDVVAVRQEITLLEKIELLAEAESSYYLAQDEPASVRSFPQYPEGEELTLPQAIARAREEFAVLVAAGACPAPRPDLETAEVLSTEFRRIVDLSQPSRQLAVWVLGFSGNASVWIDALDGKIYHLESYTETSLAVYDSQEPLIERGVPADMLETAARRFAEYHGIELDERAEQDDSEAAFSRILLPVSGSYAQVEIHQIAGGFHLRFSSSLRTQGFYKVQP